MKVWQASWNTYSDSDDHSYQSWELFTTEEAARASCPQDGKVSEVEVRAEPLATETRYRVGSNRHHGDDKVPEVYTPKRFVVNELQEEFGKPLIEEYGWWLDGPTVNSASRAEALAFVHTKLDPEIEREQERLDRIATWTHQFRCPDHGDLSMSAPGNHVPCVTCHRWVDDQGRRFGHYVNLPATEPREPWTIPIHIAFSAGGTGTDHDLGPLPEDELQAFLDRSSAGE